MNPDNVIEDILGHFHGKGAVLDERDYDFISDLLKREREMVLQDLETFLNNIPEEYGGGEKEADINHGYQLCAKIVKAELRHFIDQRINKTDKQTEV